VGSNPDEGVDVRVVHCVGSGLLPGCLVYARRGLLRHRKISTPPLSLNLDTRERSVVSVTPRSVCYRGDRNPRIQTEGNVCNEDKLQRLQYVLILLQCLQPNVVIQDLMLCSVIEFTC
jgi:hypothetical protein